MNAVGIRAIGGRQWGCFSRTIDDGGQPFVRIVEHREIFRQALKPLVQEHAPSVAVGSCAASPRVALLHRAQRAILRSRSQP